MQSLDTLITKETKLLTPAEAAERIGVKEPTLRNWRCTKIQNIPYLKVGGKVFYAEQDLIDFLNRKRVA
ncbi:helix-turn-helix domain-containing protein [Nitrosomonas sp. Is35]|uniref:helix-turn-helix domain-containing protein n=1 Tax=Nitrosomonas sp. Is35 TaxID=3080534 RepID=UPI00294B04B1|nr:helix-turn-helix domain-containing protein [Nitrosomonas sp. Is35]MDV6347523.1 helix-turn-helix domain-containing protein [Nitrosomonas sp. Is35]